MDALERVEARFYDQSGWDNVTCRLCPQLCSIAPSRSGGCGIRTNRGGKLYLDQYARVTFKEPVPGEELPLYHYKPEAQWLLLAGRGCTMRCGFCNTYRYSQGGGVMSSQLLPSEVPALAKQFRASGVSFGVNEPAPMHEFVFDVFQQARAAGMDTHLATNGMWSTEPLAELLPLTCAITFGLKGMDEALYQRELGGDLPTIIANIRTAIARKVHIEISWLVIPGITDKEPQFQLLSDLLAGMGAEPPVIMLPFTPDYQWRERAPAAGLAELQRARALLRKTYSGPIYEAHEDSAENTTRCTICSKALVRRGLAGLIITKIPSGRPKNLCPQCNAPVPYVADP